MLTEEQREIFVNDFKQNVTWEYDSWDINPKIMREGAVIDKKRPSIVFGFRPTSRRKFRSISDVIGKATEYGEYKEYGWCQLEQCTIRFYCHEHHKNRTYNGRTIAEYMSRLGMTRIIRQWDGLFFQFGLAFDRQENLGVVDDVSIFDPITKTYFYIFEISFMIRTHFRWNYIPSDYVEDVIIESIGIDYKSINEDAYKYKRIIVE